MKSLTYIGPGGARVFTKAEDGFDTDRRFEVGVPLEISEADAARILGGPHADEFTTEAPSAGHTSKED